MTLPARIYIGLMVAAAAAVTTLSLAAWRCEGPARLALYLVLAMAASTLKIRLPGLQSSVTPGFLFVLLGVADLSLGETSLVCLLSGLVQTLWKPARTPKAIQVAFNIAAITVAGALAHTTAHSALPGPGASQALGRVAIALVTLFFANILAVAAVLALIEGKALTSILRTTNYWAFPYYVAGTGIAVLIQYSVPLGITPMLQQMPIVYMVHLFYSEYVRRQQSVS